MKGTLLILTTILASFGAFSQTATDFTCNDCAGSSHNLFSELDGGKVVVLVWVMPFTVDHQVIVDIGVEISAHLEC